MNKKVIPILSAGCSAVCLLLACLTAHSQEGYIKKRMVVKQQIADSIKKNIQSINNTQFLPFTFHGANAFPLSYRMLTPSNTAHKTKYPLIVVFHGSGAVGTDNTAQLGILAKYWAQPAIREQYPAFVIAPQFPQRSSNYVMLPGKKVSGSAPAENLHTALELIDSLKKVLPIDTSRIYVIGFSMGASTTINAIGRRPDLFAAGVAISGIPEFQYLHTLAQKPLWIIHGNAGNENAFSSDSLLYRELQPLKPAQLKFWEIEGLEHEVYPALYTTPAMPQWLFKQSLKKHRK